MLHPQALLDSDKVVVVRGQGLIAEVKCREDCLLWEVTRKTRDDLPARSLTRLKQIMESVP